MKKQRRWVIGLLSIIIVIVAGYACQELPSGPSDSGQEQAFDVQKMDIKANSMAANVPLNFRANLKGANEVPPVETNAQGQAIFQVDSDGESIHYKLIVANIENVRMAHIHVGPAGVNGPVVVWLYPAGPPPQLIEGRSQGVLAEGTFTADDFVGLLEGEPLAELIDLMKEAGVYVNVHTSQFPPGEIRGQIR